MKQKKRLAVIAFLLCLVMVFGLASCGSDAGTPTTSPSANPGTPTISPSADPIEEPSGDTTMTLVMAEVDPIDSIIGQMDQEFKKQVEELSGGSIIIDIKADGVLGAEEEVLDSMVNHPDSNTIDIARISAFSLNSYGVEKTVFLTLPFIFETTRHFWNFAESELAQEFLNEPQEIGLPVRGLFFGTEGFRHFFVNNDLPLDSI